MGKKAKVIKLLLENGTLNGKINMAEDEWIGDFYSSPRSNVNELFKDDTCDKWGIYLLLSVSPRRVYVGQSKQLKKRIKQHILGKDWWESVVILTTKDDSFNKSDIDYLENVLIDKAYKSQTLDIDNKKTGNLAKVDRFRAATLDQYLEESIFILEFIGVNVFSDSIKKQNLNNIVPTNSEQTRELREKKETLNFLEQNSISLNKPLTYSRYQKDKKGFWLNTRTDYLKQNLMMVLNNQEQKKIYVLEIPANELQFAYPREKNKLLTRKDKRNELDLLINGATFVDKSGISFKKYIKNTISY